VFNDSSTNPLHQSKEQTIFSFWDEVVKARAENYGDTTLTGISLPWR
ncbi:19929_t:CDS:1, partial [Rhizophagus irregularis]